MRLLAIARARGKFIVKCKGPRAGTRWLRDSQLSLVCYSHVPLGALVSLSDWKEDDEFLLQRDTWASGQRQNWLGLEPDAGNGGRQHLTLPAQRGSGRLVWVELRFAVA